MSANDFIDRFVPQMKLASGQPVKVLEMRRRFPAFYLQIPFEAESEEAAQAFARQVSELTGNLDIAVIGRS